MNAPGADAASGAVAGADARVMTARDKSQVSPGYVRRASLAA